VIELQIGVDPESGVVSATRQWHGKNHFQPPKLPRALVSAALPYADAGLMPGIEPYCQTLKNLSSAYANWERRLFKGAALLIIVVHVLATICATIALKLHSALIPWMLGGELLFLATGFGVHQTLHVKHSLERWALFRLAAEVGRSTLA